MSEDEIIDTLTDIHTCIYMTQKQHEAIRGLLDLYQKEREKNNKIQKYVRSNEWAEDYEKSSCRTKILRILEEN